MSQENLTLLGLRLGIHFLFVCLIVFGLYFRHSRNRQFCFSFVAISASVFILCYVLQRVDLELGFALGLFAIFGIIRYRTITIPTKEMTYLFVVIGLSVVNSLAGTSVSLPELVLINAIVWLCLLLLEWFSIRESIVTVTYEKVENLREGRQALLIADLQERTGQRVKRFEIEAVDYLRDTALLHVTLVPIEHASEAATSLNHPSYEESFQTTRVSQSSLR